MNRRQLPFEVAFPLPDCLPTPGAGTMTEPARELPVVAECDVAVLGGGPAGVCAAAAAARAGKRVVLIERHGYLGGMATAANVNVWHTLYGTDGATKVIGGLAEEIIRRLQRLGAARNYKDDGETGNWTVCSETTKLVMDDLVVGSGVKLLFNTFLAGALRDGRRITAAIVEGKGGRGAVRADVFIDCTGDADLVRKAGLSEPATHIGDARHRCQPPTLCFRVGGLGDPKESGEGRGIQARLFADVMDYNGGKYPCFLWGTKGIWDDREMMWAGTRVPGVNCADTRDFSRAELEARYQMRWVLGKMREMPGWEESYLVDIGAQIGVRESHRILAEHQLTREEVLEGRRFDDAIAQGCYPIDIHNPTGPGIVFEYLDGRRVEFAGDMTRTETRWDNAAPGAPKRDTLCWQAPYRSLAPRALDNVLAAGRCIGAEHNSAGAIRVMINAMQFGQAAGTAAALMAAGQAARNVDTARLRAALLAADVPLLPA
ncbi:MAG: hypothetical protein BIFFINMI_00766 [Phycisphaerae bacterium]|nr:hypothetical protein [Phycisphaerae bacterium]